MDEVREKLRRGNEILFSKNSACLAGLRAALEGGERRVAVLWALDVSSQAVESLEERYPGESRPREALETARLWAAGRVKMPAARQAILSCHGLAKELDDPADAALCHAVAQSCSTVHTPLHAIGFPLYELTALVRRYGPDNCREPVESRLTDYRQRLAFWAERGTDGLNWAAFLRKG
ncbi:MAG TPA: hypothetical protein H9668_06960 [Firmicutes bacterium]|nr:hypothetical protein [Bacillota bacterium]